MNRIAVIIVNFNGGDLLVNCINKLLLDESYFHKVIVIDNASDDNSLDNIPNKSCLDIIKLDNNIGFAAANNYALSLLDDIDLVMTLNPDAFIKKGCIKKLLSVAEENPDIDSFSCRMMANENILDGAGDNYHISGLPWRSRHRCKINCNDFRMKEVFSPCAGAALYRREALVAVGGFDERFFCYVEDVDLGYRMRLMGMRCLYVPDAVVEHLGSAISNQYPGFALYHGHRNLVWCFIKNTPMSLLLLMLPFHLLMTIVLMVVFLVRGQFKLYLKAKVDALKDLPLVLKQRKKIQKTRSVSLLALLKSYSYYIK